MKVQKAHTTFYLIKESFKYDSSLFFFRKFVFQIKLFYSEKHGLQINIKKKKNDEMNDFFFRNNFFLSLPLLKETGPLLKKQENKDRK